MEIFKLFGSIGVKTDEAERGLDGVNKKGQGTANGLGSAFSTAAKVIGTVFAADKLIDFGKLSVKAAATSQAVGAQFEQVFQKSAPAAQKKIDELADTMGILPNRIKPAFTMMTSKFKGLGLDTEDAMKKAEQATSIAANAAAFYDKSLEEAQGSLNSFVNGNYEGGEVIGLFANETQLAAYAAKNGYLDMSEEAQKFAEKQGIAVEKATNNYSKMVEKHGADSLQARDAQQKMVEAQEKLNKGVGDGAKKFADLSEAEKQAIRLDYAEDMLVNAGAIDEMGKATGQASREQDQLENVLGNVKQAWQDFLAVVGTPILKAVLPIMTGITDVLMKMKDYISPLLESFDLWDVNWKGLINTGGDFSSTIEGLKTLFEGLKNIGLSLIEMFVSLFSPMLTVITENTWRFKDIWDKVLEIFNMIVEFVQPLIAALQPIAEVLGNLFGVVLQEAFKMLTMVFTELRDTFSELLPIIQETVMPILQALADWFVANFPTMKQYILDFYAVVQEVFGTGMDIIREIALAVLALIRGDWEGLSGSLKEIVRLMWEYIKGEFSRMGEGIKNTYNLFWEALKLISNTIAELIKTIIRALWDMIKQWFEEGKNFVVNTVTQFWNKVKEIFQLAAQAIVNFVQNAWNTIKNVFSQGRDNVTGTASNLWTRVKDTFTKGADAAKNAVSNMVKSVKEFFSNGLDSIVGTARNIFNDVKDAIMTPIDKIVSGVRDFVNDLKDLLDVSLPIPRISLPHFNVSGNFDPFRGEFPSISVDWYAKGGIMTKPTLFGMADGKFMGGGEAGNEAILPLDSKNLAGIGYGIMDALGIDANLAANLRIIVELLKQIAVSSAEGNTINLDGRELAREVQRQIIGVNGGF